MELNCDIMSCHYMSFIIYIIMYGDTLYIMISSLSRKFYAIFHSNGETGQWRDYDILYYNRDLSDRDRNRNRLNIDTDR